MESEFLRGFILGFVGITGIYILIETLIANAFKDFFESVIKFFDKEEDEE